MRAALSKAQLEADIGSRFGDAFKIHDKAVVETLSTGVAEIDGLTGGLPRGDISEIFGPASSGRTSFIFSALAHATEHQERRKNTKPLSYIEALINNDHSHADTENDHAQH